jgi:peptidyl-prolyl cis-trans isomerase B (cyclophilin B)
MIKLETTDGDIIIALDFENAPNTAKNFEQYVTDGFYDGVIFHRVIPGFMVQGGGFETGMTEKETRANIQNEANNGLSNDIGTLAMARTNEPHSASAQFFINVANNKFLNHSSETDAGWGYCVFGKVVEGYEVVNAITNLPTGSAGHHQDVPERDVVIKKATVINDIETKES